jgi:hypothetical protein
MSTFSIVILFFFRLLRFSPKDPWLLAILSIFAVEGFFGLRPQNEKFFSCHPGVSEGPRLSAVSFHVVLNIITKHKVKRFITFSILKNVVCLGCGSEGLWPSLPAVCYRIFSAPDFLAHEFIHVLK